MGFYILIAIVFILYWGFLLIKKAGSSANMSQPSQTQPYFRREKSEEEQYPQTWENQKDRKIEKFTVKAEVQSVPPAKSEKPVSSSMPKTKQKKLTEWQKAWIMKEIVDRPRALRPYRFRQPR